VGQYSKRIVLSKCIKNRELFAEIAYLIGISHDFAKSTTYFQKYLMEGKKTEKAHHGKLSSIFGYYLVKEYLKREKIFDYMFLPFVAWLVIIKHHGDIDNLLGVDGEMEKLNDLGIERKQIEDIRRNYIGELVNMYDDLSPFKVDFERFFGKIDNICAEIQEEGENLVIKKDLGNYFLILFFYSVLLDSDKLDALEIDLDRLEQEKKKWNIQEDLVDRYKKARFDKEVEGINILRNEAYLEVVSNIKEVEKSLTDDRIFAIELPTGFGKTLTAFSFALRLRSIIERKMGFVPRIIYSLPFLSIIEQNAEVLSEVVVECAGIAKHEEIFNMDHSERKEKLNKIPSSLLLKHHHLVDVKYKTSNEELEMDIEKSLLLIEGWHSEIIITTFIQLFHSLITNRNKAARKFHNVINSILILDEVQSIPHKYWALVKETLKHLAYSYNCWVILMTATQPLIFNENEIKPLIKNKTKYFGSFNRLEFSVEIKPKKFIAFQNELLTDILSSGKDIAVVLNTINASKNLYVFLRDKLVEKLGKPSVSDEGIANFGGLLLINLTTNVIPYHRLERIKEIIRQKYKRKILITTQLIEAGVDISVDTIYRDLAPIDCIVQTGGRCNRNNDKRKGICRIVFLEDDKTSRKFCNIYDSVLIDITKEILEDIPNQRFEEKSIKTLIERYFRKILLRGSDEKSRSSMNAMQRLDFAEVGKFELIEQGEPEFDIYVNIDDESNRLWDMYERITEIKDKFERRREVLRIRNKFNKYVISVNRENAKEHMISPYLGYITGENYDLETGFKHAADDVWII